MIGGAGVKEGAQLSLTTCDHRLIVFSADFDDSLRIGQFGQVRRLLASRLVCRIPDDLASSLDLGEDLYRRYARPCVGASSPQGRFRLP